MFVPFISFISSIFIAAVTPAKVGNVETNSATPSVAKPPKVIYVRTFSINKAASSSESSGGEERPHLLGALRGGKENTVIGRHREAQHEDTLAKVPSVLQSALIEDLSQSVASAANGDGAHLPSDCWVISGEFIDVDAGNRALQAGVGLGAGQSHLEVRASVYAAGDMKRPFLTFNSQGASEHAWRGSHEKKPLSGRQVRYEQEAA